MVNVRSLAVATRLAVPCVVPAIASMAASCEHASSVASTHADQKHDPLQEATWRGPDGQEWDVTVRGSKLLSGDWDLKPQASFRDVGAKNTDHMSDPTTT